MTRPLAYLCVRTEPDAADGEYRAFLSATGLDADQLERVNLVDRALPEDALRRWRGFLVGGSPFNVTAAGKSPRQQRVERELAELVLTAAEGGTALLLACFGQSVATLTLGGAVTLDRPERAAATSVQLTDAGRADPLFGTLSAGFSAINAHKEATGRLPQDAVLLATNDACPVQAYRVGEHLYATQFHPEADGPSFTARMRVYRHEGYFDPAEYEATAARVLAADLTQPPLLLRAFATRF